VNIKNGTRYKVTAEVIKKLQIDFIDKLQFDVNKGFMTVIGFDARHYARLDRHSIFAIRAAGSTSIGSEKILNYLGGTDNSMFQGFGTSVATPQGTYAYQVAAANLRGFGSNIRNGNSYALINSELRIPIMRYIFNRPMNSFWRNLQLVGFFDMGTAWHGVSPFRKDNPLNTIVVAPGAPPIIVTVNYFKDPLVAGYGVGGRFWLFGYMIRVDRAWGIETRQIQNPMWHFSVGYDF
jgi:outer membrane protein assembly factor BamA